MALLGQAEFVLEIYEDGAKAHRQPAARAKKARHPLRAGRALCDSMHNSLFWHRYKRVIQAFVYACLPCNHVHCAVHGHIVPRAVGHPRECRLQSSFSVTLCS